jgi:hypothetical protein
MVHSKTLHKYSNFLDELSRKITENPYEINMRNLSSKFHVSHAVGSQAIKMGLISRNSDLKGTYYIVNCEKINLTTIKQLVMEINRTNKKRIKSPLPFAVPIHSFPDNQLHEEHKRRELFRMYSIEEIKIGLHDMGFTGTMSPIPPPPDHF